MRLHIALQDELVELLDKCVGPRDRSRFIARVVAQALDDEHRWELIKSSLGSIREQGRDWDSDPAAWVRAQRRGNELRVG